jgi:hypothetical protein
MRLRQQHIEALSLASEHAFVDRMVSFLQVQFEDAAAEPRLVLLEGVRAQIEKARRYGMTTQQQIATYVTTAWMLGPDFDVEFTAAMKMLSSHNYPTDEKANWLVQWTQQLFLSLEEEG